MSKRSRRRRRRKSIGPDAEPRAPEGTDETATAEAEEGEDEAKGAPRAAPDAAEAPAAAAAEPEADARETSAARRERDNVVQFPAKGPSLTPVPGRITGAAVTAARSDAAPAAELTPPPIRAMEQQFYDSAPDEADEMDFESGEREPLPRAMWVALVIVGLAVAAGGGLLVYRAYFQIQPVALQTELDQRAREAQEAADAKKRGKRAKKGGEKQAKAHAGQSEPGAERTARPEVGGTAGPDVEGTAQPEGPAATAEPATTAPETAAPETAAPETAAPEPAGAEAAEKIATLLEQGAALNRRGNGAGALQRFEEALALDANNARAHAGVAIANLNMGRMDPAIAAAERAAALDDSIAEANFVIGYVRRRTDADVARAALERCVAAKNRTWSGECAGLLRGLR